MRRKKKRVFYMARIAGIFSFILGLAFFAPLENFLTGFAVSAQQTMGELTEEKSEETKAVAESAGGSISIDFKDADIHSVLRLLAEKSGVNIVAGEEVKGRITIKLVNVPWQRALDVILRTYGFVYERDENVVRVTTVENLEKEDVITRVFSLNYANAQEVSEVIAEMKSERGKVKFDERMNLLVITDVPANLTKIGEVIEKVDTLTLQVLVEAKIVEVSLGEEENIGVNWSALKGVSVGTSGVKREYTRTKTDTKEDIHKFSQGAIKDDELVAVGGTPPWPGTYPAYTAKHDLSSDIRDVVTDIRTAVLSVSDFNVVLSALKERRDFNLVSTPRIVTTNNRESMIHVGKTVPIPKYQYNKDTGTWEIAGYDFKETGVTLKVTPNISKDKRVTLIVHPEISEIDGWTGRYNEIPILKVREANTQVVVGDSDTLVIGGLIKEEPKETVNKVPVLGNIPFLGWFFTHKKIEKEKIDLIIFLTPTILEDKRDGGREEKAGEGK